VALRQREWAGTDDCLAALLCASLCCMVGFDPAKRLTFKQGQAYGYFFHNKKPCSSSVVIASSCVVMCDSYGLLVEYLHLQVVSGLQKPDLQFPFRQCSALHFKPRLGHEYKPL